MFSKKLALKESENKFFISNLIGHAAKHGSYKILAYLLKNFKELDVNFPTKVVDLKNTYIEDEHNGMTPIMLILEQ